MVRANSIVLRPSAIDDLSSVHSLYRAVAESPGGLARLPVEITRSYVENFLHATISRGLGFVAVDERKEIEIGRASCRERV